MAEKKKQIFRERSLEKLSSPDRLDQLLRIVRPHAWILLMALGVGLGLAIVWSIFGRIPETASGTAILVRPKTVVAFQSPASGQIASIEVQVGDRVEQGTLLAKLSLPTLEKDLEQEQAKLEQLKSRTQEMSEFDRRLAESEKKHIASTRLLIQRRIDYVRKSADEHKQSTEAHIEAQRKNIRAAQESWRELAGLLQERYQAQLDLGDVTSQDRVVDARARVVQNQLELDRLELREQALKLAEIAARESYEKGMDLIRDLDIQLSNLALDELRIDQHLREDEIDAETEIKETERRIAFLQTQLNTEGILLSDHAGLVLEVSVAQGSLVATGQGLGRMEIEDPDAELMALAYFSIKDGKRIKDGRRIKDGKRIRSTPEEQTKIRISPTTVEKERWGGIIGTVVTVTDYPVTTEAAANQIGDLEIARNLLGGQSRIGVQARLNPAARGEGLYEWTSGEGPDGFELTAGTTAEVRVTIRERAPITLILPFLESLSGT